MKMLFKVLAVAAAAAGVAALLCLLLCPRREAEEKTVYIPLKM